LADLLATFRPWTRLLPFASSVAAQQRLTAPEELTGGPPQWDITPPALAEQGALRFLIAAVEFDGAEPAWPASDLKSYLRLMEVCGHLRADVNTALAQRHIECRVRLYAPVPVSRAVTYGTLSHAAAVVHDRIRQAATGGGWSVSQLGVRLFYREGERILELQVLSPSDQTAPLFTQAIPVFDSEGGLPHSVQSVAGALIALGAHVVDCDASTSPILVDFVRQRGKDLEVLLKGLQGLTAASNAKRV
jgi:hypothetical protein